MGGTEGSPAAAGEAVRDLLEVLQRRFGRIPEDLVRQVLGLAEPDVIDRLILVAANAPSLDRFRRELEAGPQTFRLPGLG